jgi:glutathione S-transferase
VCGWQLVAYYTLKSVVTSNEAFTYQSGVNAMSIVIYGRHTSYNVQKVLWLLEELQLDYQHIEFGQNLGDTETDEFGKLNPMRKVPVLVDGDRVIWESNTILRYLSYEYGDDDWLVQDAYQR